MSSHTSSRPTTLSGRAAPVWPGWQHRGPCEKECGDVIVLARGTTISRRTLLTVGLGAGVVSVLAALHAARTSGANLGARRGAHCRESGAKPAAAHSGPPAAAATSRPPPRRPAGRRRQQTSRRGANPIWAQLVGKLEGATIVTDAGADAQDVQGSADAGGPGQGGKLPPVEKRLPDEPMVLKPAHEVGKYGGTWRRAFTGPADGENVNRIMATDKMLHVDFTGIKIVPSVAKDWKLDRWRPHHDAATCARA